MKRLIVLIVVIFMAVPAYAKKKKTVEIKDNIIMEIEV